MIENKNPSTTPSSSPNKGFQLPAPSGEGKKPLLPGGENKTNQGVQTGTTKTITETQTAVQPKRTDTQTRDISIGIGILIGCMVIFLFAKKKFSNWLVERRKNPQSANAAGLWLFILLTSLAAGVIFPLLRSETFYSTVFFAPVGGLVLISTIFLAAKSR